MLLAKLIDHYYNKRFAAANKSLEKHRKKISRKFVGVYGIHSIAVSNPDQDIKVFVHKISEIPSVVKKKILSMGGKFKVRFVQSEVKNPSDYHMEEVFKIKL